MIEKRKIFEMGKRHDDAGFVKRFSFAKKKVFTQREERFLMSGRRDHITVASWQRVWLTKESENGPGFDSWRGQEVTPCLGLWG